MYLLLLPIVDMATCDYRSERVLPDLKRNLSETALPAAHVEEVAYDICCGLVDGNGAEDEPLWMIWDETEERRYGAFWWQDAQELQLFTEDEDIPSEYITAPQKGGELFMRTDAGRKRAARAARAWHMCRR